MPVGFSARGRRPAFELVESRLLLAADGLSAADAMGDEPPVMYLPGSIAGSVYAVSEVDGATPANGVGISDVRLELLSEAGEALAAAITDDGGAYEFPALEPGVYSVRQSQPDGVQDGAAKVGSGGGAAITANHVSQIVVEPGAMLRGYDFLELLGPIVAEVAPEPPQSSAGFIPPLVVSWSRPPDLVTDPIHWPVAMAPLRTAPAELRPLEPVFGGSSGVIEEESLYEAHADTEFIEQIAKPPQSGGDAETGERVAMKRRASWARDRAFELDGEPEDDGADDVGGPADAAPQATHRADVRERVIVRKPAA